MTLSDTIKRIESVASGQPAIHSIIRNDIFRLNSLPNAKYGVFGWTQGQHSGVIGSSLINFNFTFFYIDRLTEDKSNQVEIQSVGVSVLTNILHLLAEIGITSENYTITTFNQRFLDECSGAFCSVSLEVPVGYVCGESYVDFNDDFNEDFAIGGDVTIY